MLGNLDLRSIGYYKIKCGILQQDLSKYEQFNKFINTLKKEKDETKDNYP